MVNRCKICGKALRDFNKSGICSNCRHYSKKEKEKKIKMDLKQLKQLKIENALKNFNPLPISKKVVCDSCGMKYDNYNGYGECFACWVGEVK